MCFVSSFAVQLQELAVVMTVPSFQNFVIVLTGWAFARRRTALVAVSPHDSVPRLGHQSRAIPFHSA